MIDSINGLLLPGGSTYFNGTNNYFATSKLMYQLALQVNEHMKFPILGICLGFELLVHLSNNEQDIRKRCDGLKDVNIPLRFAPKFKNASLFRNASRRIIRTLRSNVPYNYHMWCVYLQDFQASQGITSWRILSTSLDQLQSPFISAIEHRKYPIAGVQFHPEKHGFEWSLKKQYLHTSEAIQAGRHLFDWLIEQSKLNNQSFSSLHDENRSLIYNYCPLFSSPYNVSYTEMYLF